MFRYPTAHSHPCNLTSEILALSVVENIRILGRYATSLGTYNIVTWGGLAWRPEFGWRTRALQQVDVSHWQGYFINGYCLTFKI